MRKRANYKIYVLACLFFSLYAGCDWGNEREDCNGKVIVANPQVIPNIVRVEVGETLEYDIHAEPSIFQYTTGNDLYISSLNPDPSIAFIGVSDKLLVIGRKPGETIGVIIATGDCEHIFAQIEFTVVVSDTSNTR